MPKTLRKGLRLAGTTTSNHTSCSFVPPADTGQMRPLTEFSPKSHFSVFHHSDGLFVGSSSSPFRPARTCDPLNLTITVNSSNPPKREQNQSQGQGLLPVAVFHSPTLFALLSVGRTPVALCFHKAVNGPGGSVCSGRILFSSHNLAHTLRHDVPGRGSSVVAVASDILHPRGGTLYPLLLSKRFSQQCYPQASISYPLRFRYQIRAHARIMPTMNAAVIVPARDTTAMVPVTTRESVLVA